MPRPVIVAVIGLLAISLGLFANYWVDAFGTDLSVRRTFAATAALPFIIAIMLYGNHPAPGQAVGKKAPSVGSIQLVASATMPFMQGGLPKSGHAYCIVFWSLTNSKPVERVETLCRASASDRMHFLMVSADEPDKLDKFAKGAKIKKRPLSVALAADSSGAAFENFMFQNNEHGIPHAFVIGSDGVITWHGHPSRPQLLDHLRKVIHSLPPRPQSAGAGQQGTPSSSENRAAAEQGETAGKSGAKAEAKKNK